MALADLRTGAAGVFEAKFRAIFFATDSFAARLYETEADLPGSLSGGVLYGRGTRWYIILSWSPSRVVRLSGKFSRIGVGDRKNIGSGAGEIRGNVSEQVGVQFDVDF